MQIDIHQESGRHTNVLAELLYYLELGDYKSWSEEEKQTFLLIELSSKRPLFQTIGSLEQKQKRGIRYLCQVIADSPTDTIATYIVSMTKVPSDILAVKLLLKESGRSLTLPVVPLFETLDDLNNAENVIKKLLTIP